MLSPEAAGLMLGTGGVLLSEPGMPIASRMVLRSSTYNSERVLEPSLRWSKSSVVISFWLKSRVMLTWALTLASPTMGASNWTKRVR